MLVCRPVEPARKKKPPSPSSIPSSPLPLFPRLACLKNSTLRLVCDHFSRLCISALGARLSVPRLSPKTVPHVPKDRHNSHTDTDTDTDLRHTPPRACRADAHTPTHPHTPTPTRPARARGARRRGTGQLDPVHLAEGLRSCAGGLARSRRASEARNAGHSARKVQRVLSIRCCGKVWYRAGGRPPHHQRFRISGVLRLRASCGAGVGQANAWRGV